MPYTPSPFEGDLMLFPTMDGGDIQIIGGQPIMDPGMSTAVYISLFGQDFWGNSIAPDNSHKLNSKLETIVAGKFKGTQTQNDIQAAALTALQWMIEDGVASAVTALATIPAPDQIMLTVGITQPGAGTPAYLKYLLNWTNQAAQVSQIWY
jgi:phage gp46-like protein